MSRLIDADALIEFCAERWIPLNIDAVNMQPTIQPELDSETLIQTINTGITATNSNDAYSLGMRNGMRWCKSLIDGAEPKFEYGATRGDDGTDSAELPTAQPVATDTNVGNNSEIPNSWDCISRQQAIDAIVQCTNCGDEDALRGYVLKHSLDNGWTGGILEALDAVKDLPPAQPEPQWIPVERELPEDFTDVLVWFEYFRYGDYNCLYQTHGIGTYVANYNLWTVNHETGWKDLRVIAWMPLPKPFEGGAE